MRPRLARAPPSGSASNGWKAEEGPKGVMAPELMQHRAPADGAGRGSVADGTPDGQSVARCAVGMVSRLHGTGSVRFFLPMCWPEVEKRTERSQEPGYWAWEVLGSTKIAGFGCSPSDFACLPTAPQVKNGRRGAREPVTSERAVTGEICMAGDRGGLTCPCCGYETLREREAWEICPICFWEDEPTSDPYVATGGPNGSLSLYQAQRNFSVIGASDQGSLIHVRRPGQTDQRDPNWKPLPPPR